jgi:hypothetical protein
LNVKKTGYLLVVLTFFCIACSREVLIGNKQHIKIDSKQPSDCSIVKNPSGGYTVSGESYSDPDLGYYYDDCGCHELARKQFNLDLSHGFGDLFGAGAMAVLGYQGAQALPTILVTPAKAHGDNYSDGTITVSIVATIFWLGWRFFYLPSRQEAYFREFENCSKAH